HAFDGSEVPQSVSVPIGCSLLNPLPIGPDLRSQTKPARRGFSSRRSLLPDFSSAASHSKSGNTYLPTAGTVSVMPLLASALLTDAARTKKLFASVTAADNASFASADCLTNDALGVSQIPMICCLTDATLPSALSGSTAPPRPPPPPRPAAGAAFIGTPNFL